MTLAFAVGLVAALLPAQSALAMVPAGDETDASAGKVVVDTVTYYIDGVIIEGRAIETYNADGSAEATSIAPYEAIDEDGAPVSRLRAGNVAMRLVGDRKVTWRDLQRWMDHPEQAAPIGTGRLLTRAERRAKLANARQSLRGETAGPPLTSPDARRAPLLTAAAGPAGPAAFTVAQDACMDGNYSQNDVHIRACVQQKKKGSYIAGGKRHILVGRSGLATGWSTDSGCHDCDRIEGVGTYSWSSNADRPANLNWSPASAISVKDRCTTKTTTSSAQVGGVEASESKSEEICPEKFDYWTDGNGITYYMGSKWSGKNVAKDESRGTIWTSVGKWTPSDQSGDHLNLWVHGHMWWD